MKKFRTLLIMLCCFLTLGVFSYHADNYLANENKKELENTITSLMENRKNKSISNLENENIDYSNAEIDDYLAAVLESSNIDLNTFVEELSNISFEINDDSGTINIDDSTITVNDFETYDFSVEKNESNNAEELSNLSNIIDLKLKNKIYWTGFDISAESCKKVYYFVTDYLKKNAKKQFIDMQAQFTASLNTFLPVVLPSVSALIGKITSGLHTIPGGTFIAAALVVAGAIAASVLLTMTFAGYHNQGFYFRLKWSWRRGLYTESGLAA